jgi:hypothetical protein
VEIETHIMRNCEGAGGGIQVDIYDNEDLIVSDIERELNYLVDTWWSAWLDTDEALTV